MKLSVAVIASTLAVSSAFTPSTQGVHSTSLHHSLGGWSPGAATPKPVTSWAPAPSVNAGGVPGFSGFGHATGGVAAAAPTAYSAPTKPAGPIFSGFGHANGPMGGNPPITAAKPSGVAAKKSTKVVAASGSPFGGYTPGVASAASSASYAPAKPAGPIFSGFGHATGPMGGNPPITAKMSVTANSATSYAPAKPSGPIFSGFGHANGPMGGNPPITAAKPSGVAAKKSTPVVAAAGSPFGGYTPGAASAASFSSFAPAKPSGPIFSGFGHANGPMGGNPPITAAKPSGVAAKKSTPVVAAAGSPFGGYTPGVASAASSASYAAPAKPSGPIFSGFGHANGPMGGNPPITVAKPSGVAAQKKAPVVAASGSPFGGYTPGVASAASFAPAKPVGPIFSGFGHAVGQMGGNPPITSTIGAATTSAPSSYSAPIKPAGPIFSGFGHATGPMGGNPPITAKKGKGVASASSTSYLSSL